MIIPKGALLYRPRRYVRPAELIVPGGRVFSFPETVDASHHQWPAAPAPLRGYPCITCRSTVCERTPKRQIENRKKYLEDGDRKKRTHRLCVRAGALESMAPELKGLTDAEFFTLMENVTALPEFHHELYLIVKQREEEPSDGSVPLPRDAD